MKLRNFPRLRHHRIAAVSTVSTMALLMASAAQAQTVPGQEQSARRSFEEIVVSSQRREQTLESVPIAVDVLTPETLEKVNVTTMEEMALFTPSLNFTGDLIGTNVNFSIRGLGSFAPQSNIEAAVGTVMNGIPLSRAAEFTAELDDIERIEILKGPQGSLFGANTTGGVVNIVHKKPVIGEFQGRVSASATNDEEFTTKSMLNVPLADRAAGRFNFVFKDRDGHITNLYPGAKKQKLGGEQTIFVDTKFLFDISDNMDLIVGGSYRNRNISNARQPVAVEPGALGAARLAALGFGNPDLGQKVVDDLFLANVDSAGNSNQKNWQVWGELSWDISSSVKMNWLVSLNHFDDHNSSDNQQDLDGTPASFLNDFGLADAGLIVSIPTDRLNSGFALDSGEPTDNFTDDRRGRAWDYVTQELRFSGTIDAVDWTTGFFFRDHNEKFITTTPFVRSGVLDAASRWSDVEQRNYSIFADATWHVLDTVHLFAGIRGIQQRANVDFKRMRPRVPVEDLIVTQSTNGETFIAIPDTVSRLPAVDIENEKISPTGWAGRAGVSWDLSDDLALPAGNDVSVYFNASRGYTGFGTNTGNGTTLDTLFLLPSSSRSFEVGAKAFLFDRTFNLNIALFDMRVSDFQAQINLGAGENFTFSPGDYNSSGIEVGISWLVPETPLTLDGALTLLNTGIQNAAPQPCFPSQTLEQGCFIDPDSGGPRQDINGKPGFNAPSASFNVRGTYDLALRKWLDMPFDGALTVSYTWTDDIAFNFLYDPESIQKSYGLLDLTMSFYDPAGKYRINVFGKNITDKAFASNLQGQNGTNGRSVATVGRGAEAYWGMGVVFNY